MYRWYVRFGPRGRFRLGHIPKHKTSMPQAESLRRCRGTRQHAVRLPAAHSPKQRRLTNRADFETKMPWQPHTPRWNVARTHDAMPRTLFSPTFVVAAMGKQRVPTSARMPIFDARLLRELHAQTATVNVSLEGQRAPAIVLARNQMSSAIKVGCSEFPSSRLLI